MIRSLVHPLDEREKGEASKSRHGHGTDQERIEHPVRTKLLDGSHTGYWHGDATHRPGAVTDDAVPEHTRVPHHELRAVAHAHTHRASPGDRGSCSSSGRHVVTRPRLASGQQGAETHERHKWWA